MTRSEFTITGTSGTTITIVTVPGSVILRIRLPRGGEASMALTPPLLETARAGITAAIELLHRLGPADYDPPIGLDTTTGEVEDLSIFDDATNQIENPSDPIPLPTKILPDLQSAAQHQKLWPAEHGRYEHTPADYHKLKTAAYRVHGRGIRVVTGDRHPNGGTIVEVWRALNHVATYSI